MARHGLVPFLFGRVLYLSCWVNVFGVVVGSGGAPAWSLLSISNSTVFCQQAVHNDALNGTYDAINKPVELESFESLQQYGDVFRGVSPVVLQPGTVTPSWVDTNGQERGQAVMWVPDGVERGDPRLLFVHGGGWTSGSPTTDGYAPFGAQMAKLFMMPVLVIDYTLAPIGNFSVILEEVGMSAHFLATHEPLDLLEGKNTASNPVSEAPPIFISGDSAGGGSALSALVAQASPDGLPMSKGAAFDGGVVYSAWINLESNGPTYYSQLFGIHSEGDVLLGDVNFGFDANPDEVVEANQDAARLYWDDLKDPIANPFYAPASWLENLVPISLHVGMPEVLQSDSTMFGTKAAKAGAPWVETHAFDGMWHVFEMYTQGCGSGAPVVLAQSSLKFSKQFYDAVLQGKETHSDGIFCSVDHYEYPLGQDSAQGIQCAPSDRYSSPSSSSSSSRVLSAWMTMLFSMTMVLW